MKNYEEMAENVFERSQAIIKQRDKRRKTLAYTLSAVIPCLVVAVMAVFFFGKEKPNNVISSPVSSDVQGGAYNGHGDGYVFAFEFIPSGIVDSQAFDNWIKSDSKKNLLSFINDLDIPKEKMLGYSEQSEKAYEGASDLDGCLTKERVEALYSGDMKKINEAFIDNDIALLKNGEIYSIYWLEENTVQKYKEAGLSKSEILSLLERAEKLNPNSLKKECDFEVIREKANYLE